MYRTASELYFPNTTTLLLDAAWMIAGKSPPAFQRQYHGTRKRITDGGNAPTTTSTDWGPLLTIGSAPPMQTCSACCILERAGHQKEFRTLDIWIWTSWLGRVLDSEPVIEASNPEAHASEQEEKIIMTSWCDLLTAELSGFDGSASTAVWPESPSG
jgi:hypothetical protein